MGKRNGRAGQPNRKAQAAALRRQNRVALPAASDEFTIAYERFARYLRSAPDAERAAASARLDVRTSAERIIRLAYGLDLIRVVSSVRVAMIMEAARSREDPPAAILELIALVLMDRDATTLRETVAAVAETNSKFMPPDLVEVTRSALYAGSMISLFEATPADPQSRIRFYSAQREIMLRNPVYPHMLLASALQ